MSNQRAQAFGRATLAAWLALAVSIACWPLGESGIGWIATAVAGVPLLPAVPGIARGARRTLRWAPLAPAPALALSLTEILVNAAARTRATASLALAFIAFAALIATLRAGGRD
jgi:uncharacterized membrane protein